MTMSKSKDSSFREKTLRALSYITVEPSVTVSLFVLYLYATLGKQYIFLRLAQDYNLTQTSRETSCNETVDDPEDTDYLLFQKVSAETASWVFYLSIATFVPAIFSTVVLGSWSDKFGRKFPILASSFGFVILILGYVIVINLNAPVPYLIIGHFLCGLLGDSATLLTCSYSYITDITKPKERTFRITVIETCAGVGGLISGLSGGVWLDRKGFVTPFWYLLAFTVLNFIYVVIRIDADDKNWFANLKYLFTKEPFVHMYEVLKPQPINKRRHISIILYLASYFVIITSIAGISLILVVYEIGLPFCWNPIQVGISQAIVQSGNFVILALVKIFSGVTAEVKLIILGLTSNFVSCFILAFAVSDWMIYFALVIQMVYLIPSPILRSQLSRVVSTDEIGPVFALQSCVGNISWIVASGLFNSVFAATIDSALPGAAFLLSPVLILIFGVLYRFVYVTSKHSLLTLPDEYSSTDEDKL